jgi:mannose-1-phosphate guanylyltransferase
MLPIAGRPMIERVVQHLGMHGVDEVILSLGYRPDAFEKAYPDGTCVGVDVSFVVEDEPLGTAGAIRFAAKAAKIDETFLVLNGDVLTDLDVTALVAFHRAKGAQTTLNLTRVDDPSRFGVVETDNSGRVLNFIEKPPAGTATTNYINAGTYIMEPGVVDLIPEDREVSVERETFVTLAETGLLYASQSDVYWIDTGTPETLLQANYDMIDGRRTLPLENAVLQGEIHSSAIVRRSAVGVDAFVRADATVIDSVVMGSAVVGEGAHVAGSILGERVRVGEGAVVTDGSVIGDGVEIPAGETVSARRVPEST